MLHLRASSRSWAMTQNLNIVALDQEQGGIMAVINGRREWSTPDATPDGTDWRADERMPQLFDPVADLSWLPAGGGFVVGDGNLWAVRNELSVSQYCWPDHATRERFIDELEKRGYKAFQISNKLAESLYRKEGVAQALAVVALYHYTEELVGRTGSFDSGYTVRASRGDNSFGQRRQVVEDFLRLQNMKGYESGFADDVVQIAFDALSRDQRPLFGLGKTKASCKSRNRLMAVAVCTHDPVTGLLRTHEGQPWGMGFITRHILGLNGVMRGTGERSPGNPMRAVLRILGRRHGDKVDAAERAALDKAVRDVIRALRAHPQLRTSSSAGGSTTPLSTGPEYTVALSHPASTAGEEEQILLFDEAILVS